MCLDLILTNLLILVLEKEDQADNPPYNPEEEKEEDMDAYEAEPWENQVIEVEEGVENDSRRLPQEGRTRKLIHSFSFSSPSPKKSKSCKALSKRLIRMVSFRHQPEVLRLQINYSYDPFNKMNQKKKL